MARYNACTVIFSSKHPRCLLPAALLAACTWAQTAAAQRADKRDAPRNDTVNAFVLGNVEFTVLHELAHVIIDELKVPIIGPQEGAADYIATTVLIRAGEFDPGAAERARKYLFATAKGLATSWDVGLTTGRKAQFWDAHALTIQRFYQIMCLVYGSNPKLFAELPRQVGMPEKRTAGCAQEFARADASLRWLLDNYGRKPGDPPSADISIDFDPPPTRVSAQLADVIRASGMLDNTVRRLREHFALPQPLKIVFRACHAPQAIWLPARREVAVCYELLDNYYLLATDRHATGSALGEPP